MYKKLITTINLKDKDKYFDAVAYITVYDHTFFDGRNPNDIPDYEKFIELLKNYLISYLHLYDIKINSLLTNNVNFYLYKHLKYLTKIPFYKDGDLVNIDEEDSILRILSQSYVNQWATTITIFNTLNNFLIKDITNIIILYYSNYILSPTDDDINNIYYSLYPSLKG